MGTSMFFRPINAVLGCLNLVVAKSKSAFFDATPEFLECAAV
jgi:hypothetical protein